MGFGKRLQEARKAAGLSGEELGKRCGNVSKQLISHWEHERYAPDVNQLVMLCRALSVSADWLVFDAFQARSAEAERKAALFDASHPPPAAATQPPAESKLKPTGPHYLGHVDQITGKKSQKEVPHGRRKNR